MHCTMPTNAFYSAPPPNFFPYGYPSPHSAGPFPSVPFPPQYSQPTPFNYSALPQFSYPPHSLPQLNPYYGVQVQGHIPGHPSSPPPLLPQPSTHHYVQHQTRSSVPHTSPPSHLLPNPFPIVQHQARDPVPTSSPAPSPLPKPIVQVEVRAPVSPPVPNHKRDWDYDRMTVKNEGDIKSVTYKKQMEALLKKPRCEATDIELLALCLMRNRFLDPDVVDLHYLRRDLATRVLSARVQEIRAGKRSSTTLFVGTGKGNNSKEGARTIKEDVIENAAKAGIKCKEMPGNGGFLILEISPK